MDNKISNQLMRRHPISLIWVCLIRIGVSAGQDAEGSAAAGCCRGAAPAVWPCRQPPGEAQVPRGEFQRIICMTKDFIFSASFAVENKSKIHSSHTKLIQECTFDVCVLCLQEVLDFGRKVRRYTQIPSPQSGNLSVMN